MKRQITIKTQGPMGSGKTFVMMEIIDALKERGFTIVQQTVSFISEDSLVVEFDPAEVARKKVAVNAEQRDAIRYRKLQRYMACNVKPKGWEVVETLGGIAAWTSIDEMDKHLDHLPECNVGLCEVEPK